jgi:hypothetical protein
MLDTDCILWQSYLLNIRGPATRAVINRDGANSKLLHLFTLTQQPTNPNFKLTATMSHFPSRSSRAKEVPMGLAAAQSSQRDTLHSGRNAPAARSPMSSRKPEHHESSRSHMDSTHTLRPARTSGQRETGRHETLHQPMVQAATTTRSLRRPLATAVRATRKRPADTQELLEYPH